MPSATIASLHLIVFGALVQYGVGFRVKLTQEAPIKDCDDCIFLKKDRRFARVQLPFEVPKLQKDQELLVAEENGTQHDVRLVGYIPGLGWDVDDGSGVAVQLHTNYVSAETYANKTVRMYTGEDEEGEEVTFRRLGGASSFGAAYMVYGMLMGDERARKRVAKLSFPYGPSDIESGAMFEDTVMNMLRDVPFVLRSEGVRRFSPSESGTSVDVQLTYPLIENPFICNGVSGMKDLFESSGFDEQRMNVAVQSTFETMWNLLRTGVVNVVDQPHNILYDRTTGEPTFIDFDSAFYVRNGAWVKFDERLRQLRKEDQDTSALRRKYVSQMIKVVPESWDVDRISQTLKISQELALLVKERTDDTIQRLIDKMLPS